MPTCALIGTEGFFNELQARKNWPHPGPPLVLDVRPKVEYDAAHVRGAFHVEIATLGHLDGVGERSWAERTVILVGASERGQILAGGEVAQYLLTGNSPPSRLLTLSPPFEELKEAYPFLCASSDSRSSMKRPSSYPSCIVSGLLYLGDIEDAANVRKLHSHLKVTHVITALADPPQSLTDAVREAGMHHLWCCVRDVAGADIKEHFDKSYAFIEEARAAGSAVFIHCSRGVSRSASLVLAYLMRTREQSVEEALSWAVERRPIVNPNEGFLQCLREFGRELRGERSGVYIPRRTGQPEDLGVELPPKWAAVGTSQHPKAKLLVMKNGEEVDTLDIGEHPMYMFGRSLTCDFQLEHPSASRQHAVLVHGQDGGVYLMDLNSSHGSSVGGKRVRPREPIGPLPLGTTISFGASSRQYRLIGLAEPASSTGMARPTGTAIGTGGAEMPADSGMDARLAQLRAVAGTLADEKADGDEDEVGGNKRSRDGSKGMHPKKLAKKKRKWIAGPKSSSRMSENERVARMAGSGSGVSGPGDF